MKVATRVGDRLAVLIERALAKHAPGEALTYDVGLNVYPGEGWGHGVILSMPSAILGQQNTFFTVFANAHTATDEQVEETVLGMLEQLRQRRSQELALRNGSKPPPPSDLSFPQTPRQ
jgi:hypothetical protein